MIKIILIFIITYKLIGDVLSSNIPFIVLDLSVLILLITTILNSHKEK